MRKAAHFHFFQTNQCFINLLMQNIKIALVFPALKPMGYGNCASPLNLIRVSAGPIVPLCFVLVHSETVVFLLNMGPKPDSPIFLKFW